MRPKSLLPQDGVLCRLAYRHSRCLFRRCRSRDLALVIDGRTIFADLNFPGLGVVERRSRGELIVGLQLVSVGIAFALTHRLYSRFDV